MKIVGVRFIGQITTAKSDGESAGLKYKVHIPELLKTTATSELYDDPRSGNQHGGIWCKNRIGTNQISHSLLKPSNTARFIRNEDPHNNNGRFGELFLRSPHRVVSAGSYYPLMEGSVVTVEFKNNNYNSGIITEVISDHKYHPHLVIDSKDLAPSAYELSFYRNSSLLSEMQKNRPVRESMDLLKTQGSGYLMKLDNVFTNEEEQGGKNLIERGYGSKKHALDPLPHYKDRDEVYVPFTTPMYDMGIIAYENTKNTYIVKNIFSMGWIIDTKHIDTKYSVDAEWDDVQQDPAGNDTDIRTKIDHPYYQILLLSEGTLRTTHGHLAHTTDCHRFRTYNNKNFSPGSPSNFIHPTAVRPNDFVEQDMYEYYNLPINDDVAHKYLHTEDSPIKHVFCEGDIDIDVCNRMFVDVLMYARMRVGKKHIIDIGDNRSRSNNPYSYVAELMQSGVKTVGKIVSDNSSIKDYELLKCHGGTILDGKSSDIIGVDIDRIAECNGYPNAQGYEQGATINRNTDSITFGQATTIEDFTNRLASGIHQVNDSQKIDILDSSIIEGGGGVLIDKQLRSIAGESSSIEITSQTSNAGDQGSISRTVSDSHEGEDCLYSYTGTKSFIGDRHTIGIDNNVNVNSLEATCATSDNYTYSADTNTITLAVSHTIEGEDSTHSITNTDTYSGDSNSRTTVSTVTMSGDSAVKSDTTTTTLSGSDSSSTEDISETTSGANSPISKTRTTGTSGASSSISITNTTTASGAGSNVDVTDDTTVSGDGSLSISTTKSTGSGNTTITETTSSDGDVNITTTVSATGTTIIEESISGANAGKRIIVLTGGVISMVEISADGKVELSSSTGNAVKLNPDGNIVIDAVTDVTTNANAIINGDLSVSGDADITGSLTVGGNIVLPVGSITLAAGGITAASGTIIADNFTEV